MNSEFFHKGERKIKKIPLMKSIRFSLLFLNKKVILMLKISNELYLKVYMLCSLKPIIILKSCFVDGPWGPNVYFTASILTLVGLLTNLLKPAT
jgi:hypothetical protein